MKFYILFLFYHICFSQDFKKENIYLLGSGSESKQFMIARDFNISHKYLTHIALGIFVNNELKIFEINPDNGINSKINITDWDSFSKNSFNYIGIWEFKSNNDLSEIIKNYIYTKIQNNLTYNFSFKIDANNQEYCSQFVANALNSTCLFSFNPTIIELNDKYKSIFKTNTFTYYPIDFFLKNTQFKLIYEKNNF